MALQAGPLSLSKPANLPAMEIIRNSPGAGGMAMRGGGGAGMGGMDRGVDFSPSYVRATNSRVCKWSTFFEDPIRNRYQNSCRPSSKR